MICIEKNIDLSDKVLCILPAKELPNCQMSKFEVRKNVVTLALIKSDSLDKNSLEPKMSDFFFQNSNFDIW